MGVAGIAPFVNRFVATECEICTHAHTPHICIASTFPPIPFLYAKGVFDTPHPMVSDFLGVSRLRDTCLILVFFFTIHPAAAQRRRCQKGAHHRSFLEIREVRAAITVAPAAAGCKRNAGGCRNWNYVQCVWGSF